MSNPFLMIYFEPFFPFYQTIRCYQELRQDALAALGLTQSSDALVAYRYSLFSSRKNYRADELGMGLSPFQGYSFGIN
ncbi:MAG TPA: hypothetical protein VFW78_13835 [Bacteroidia bacterium]|nr:hypothetical protein [Bacteroidia bacterium]